MKKHTFVQKGIGFDNIADYGIILESKPILEVILQMNYDFEIISSYHLDYDWYYLNYNGKRVVVAVSQGASMAVDLAERYASSGIKKIVRIGTIGALSEDLKLGDYVVPYASIKDEGTSKFYLRVESPAISDIALTIAITQELRENKHTVNNGIIWSTDGRWKESDDAIASRISDGAIATDMESSALFAFGIDQKVSVASVSILSDEIYGVSGNQKGLSDKDIWFYKVLPKAQVAFATLLEVFYKDETEMHNAR